MTTGVKRKEENGEFLREFIARRSSSLTHRHVDVEIWKMTTHKMLSQLTTGHKTLNERKSSMPSPINASLPQRQIHAKWQNDFNVSANDAFHDVYLIFSSSLCF